MSPGGWSVWGQWAQCSSECGGGIQTRIRTCRSPPEESYLCEGIVEEGRPCNSQSCTGELLILRVHFSMSVSEGALKSVGKYKYVVCPNCAFTTTFFFTFPFLTSCLCAYVSILCKSELWLKECMLERGLWSMKNKNDMVRFLGSMSTSLAHKWLKGHENNIRVLFYWSHLPRSAFAAMFHWLGLSLFVQNWRCMTVWQTKKSDYTHYCWCYCMSFLFSYAITMNIIQQLTI